MDGVLNLNKPGGMTSHDVVDRVRRILEIKKVGHAGTLDPGASGVLIICVGKATKLAGSFMKLTKSYRGTMVLGIRTDTQDAWGKVTSRDSQPECGWDPVRKIFSEYIGEIEQIPPMYSALKYRGRRLYSLARQGIQVERPPRKVYIFSLKLLDIRNAQVEFEVECSKGTYVRTLCSDIGDRLGCGAYLARLERTRVGEFRLEDALTLEDLQALKEKGEVARAFIPGSWFLVSGSRFQIPGF